MNINDTIHGFKVERIAPAPDCGSELVEMRHEKTGARLVWLKNSGENKLFSISFRTPPSDDTGIFHILEHSVLGGSKKYPVKEPFLELMKGTMNTFLNAMTYPDKTVFPVSSRNDTDFMNLIRVYLDAVFDPAIYYNPNIFYQEGWHIEMRSEADTPVYKGVVFNEMKGALSSVYSRIESEIMNALYPDSCYRFESGGLPEAITDLTYKQFIDGHKKYYHPSNSYIYLDGPVDIEAVLQFIDSEYLSRFDRCEVSSEIPVQQPVNAVVKKAYYEISADEEMAGHTYYVVGKVLGNWKDREKNIAAAVLGEALTGSNDAPLKRAVLDTGLCLDVSLEVNDGILQPFGALVINNTDPESCGNIRETVKNKVSELCAKGIDRKLLAAAIDRNEFQFRAGGEPRGLTRNISALSAWLYGGDPLCYLELSDVYASLREKLDTGYFEELLSEWLLDESGQAELYLLPSHTYGEEQKKAEEKRIAAAVSALSCEECAVIIEQNRQLDEWQRSVDTPEQLATMPHLALSEVGEKPLEYKTEAETEGDVTVLRHPASDSGITAMNLYFSLADCTEEELSAVAAATELYGELSTERSTAAELQRRITGTLGEINFTVSVFSKRDDKERCCPYLVVNTRFLDRNTAEAFELISEILTESRLDDTEAVHELLMQADEEYKQDIVEKGHSYAMNRVRAALSASSAVAELVSGYEGYKRLHAAVKSTEKLAADIKKLSSRIICTSRLCVSVTSDGRTDVKPLLELLPKGAPSAAADMAFKLDIPEKQGIAVPSGVAYSAMAFPDNSADRAVLNVMFRVLSLEYLWNEVRVKGGAYGTGAFITAKGELAFYSFRDPSPAATIDIYRKAADFINEYCGGSPDITQYIISSIAKEEPLMSDGNRSRKADALWFAGVTYEERAAEKKRMLCVTPDIMKSAAEKLRSFGNICVIGSETSMGGLDLAVETLA